jgi:uncharacterized protein YidB (DUF937 family)
MSFFDEIKGAAYKAVEGEAQTLMGQAVENTTDGGIGGLLAKLQSGGLGEQVSSWLGDGHNLPVSADQLQSVLGDEHVQQIAQHLGLPTDQILQGLSEHLPGLAAKQAAD